MKSNLKRILMICISIGVGGTETFAVNTIKAIDTSRYNIDVYYFDGNRTEHEEELIAAGCSCYKSEAAKTGKSNIVKEIFALKRFLKLHDYDIVHCHECSISGLLKMVLGAKLAGNVKIIAHSHSVGEPKNNAFDAMLRTCIKSILSRCSDFALACSEKAGESKYTSKLINSERYSVISNGIDCGRFKFNEADRENIREKYKIGSGLLIGTVGRIAPEKNQAFLLDVFKEIAACNSDSYLMIVGQDETDGIINKKAVELNIADRVIFTGGVTDVEKYYSAMDVFVMTSLYEGMSFSVIEAQVNGLKCVLSDTIPKENCSNEAGVFLSLDSDIDIWAKEIVKAGKHRMEPMHADRIAERFNVTESTRTIEKIYDKVKHGN